MTIIPDQRSSNEAPRVRHEGSPDGVSPEPVLRVGEVAARLGVKAQTIVRYANAGILPCTRTAGGLQGKGHRRFREADVSALQTCLARPQLTAPALPDSAP